MKEADILGKADYSYSLPFYGEPRPILVDMVADGDLGVAELYDYISRKGETVYGEAFAPMTYEGKGAYLSGTASSLLDKHGEIIGAIQSIRDVSGRKQAEEELRLSEEALRKSETQLRFLSSKLLTAQEEERKRIARELHDSIGQYPRGHQIQPRKCARRSGRPGKRLLERKTERPHSAGAERR